MSKGDEKQTSVKIIVPYFFKAIWKLKPSIYLCYFVEICMSFIQPMLITIMPRFVIDELLSGKDAKKVVTYVLIMVLGYEFCGLLVNFSKCQKAKQKDAINRHFNMMLSQRTMCMDFQHTENPDILNQIEQIKSGMNYTGGSTALLDCVSGIISGIMLVVGTGFLFMMGSPLLIIIMLIAILLHVLLTGKSNAIEMKFYQERASFDRSFAYILWQLSNYRFGKEIRLYNAQDMMLKKADYYNGALADKMKEQANAVVKVTGIDTLISLSQMALVYLYLGIKVITKAIGYGDFAMYLSAITNFMNGIQSIFSHIQMIFNKSYYLGKLVDFLNMPNKMDSGEQTPDYSKGHTIEFKHVYFKYAGANDYVLKDISVSINSGEHVALVGLNGAGKTTFIKLLCRLYDVEKGEILVDGINIKEYAYDSYVKLFSVVFQDFKLFSFSLRENIVCSDTEINEAQVESDLRKVGIFEKFDSLEKKMDTSLFKDFDEKGVEPSGGEQQKIAIARALYRDASIIILDEPTAALDPIAEMEIYTHFNDLVKEKTAIFISHRLSSCMFSDRIIVFKDGKIIEMGSHNELLQIPDGEYAGMFNAQAVYYK